MSTAAPLSLAVYRPRSSAPSRATPWRNTFDIDLPLTGDLGVECRSSGGSNDYQIVVSFANPVAVNGSPQATVISGSATIGTGGLANGGRSMSTDQS